MKYRADIDGLRALAVVPVLLYHAGVPGFPGGFVGVDIFFVISGYLICGMIDGDLREGSFSLSNFYKRRMLRILPALFVMFLVTSALAYLYCLPVELEDYSKSLASAVGSVSNVYFAATAGYFDAPAETKPLLHTWSLGVEEQFYLVVPLLMLLAYRFAPKRARLFFAAAAAFSFAAAFAVSYRNTTFVFYLTPFRAWELALGALLSIKFIPAPVTERHKNACGAVGMLLLCGAIFLGSSSAPLLLMTSLASIGATLVIASSEGEVSTVGRLLSMRPVVFVGLISYSLYLWHWPLIVFQRTDGLLAAPSGAMTKLTLIAGSIAIAWLSWKFVELPFRLKAKDVSTGNSLRRSVGRDDLGRGALRPGADRGRSAVPLSRARRRDRLLSRLRSFRGVPVRPLLSRDQPPAARCPDLHEAGWEAAELPPRRRQPRRPSLVRPVDRDAGSKSDAGDRQRLPAGGRTDLAAR